LRAPVKDLIFFGQHYREADLGFKLTEILVFWIKMTAIKRRHFLRSAATLGALTVAIPVTATAAVKVQQTKLASVELRSENFVLEADPVTGSILAIAHPQDAAQMNWISSAANAPWQPRSMQWGLGQADLGPNFMHRGRWDVPLQFEADTARRRLRTVYRVGDLEVVVIRALEGDVLNERYEFTNRGDEPLPMAGGKSALMIATPFNDHYTSSADVIEHRCHAHLWMGGSSAWVALLRMGGRGPHLGLAVTEGALTGYSIAGRDEITGSNTRGTFLVHPDVVNLKPGETRNVAWTLFWHRGWDDFFAQCALRSATFVQVEATRYTAYLGETIDLTLHGRALNGAALQWKDASLPLVSDNGALRATFKADKTGERRLLLTMANGAKTSAVFNVVTPLEQLIAARVQFIVKRQQVNQMDDPANGALVVYDNETEAQVRKDKVAPSDRNEGRERVGMGVLLARTLRAWPGQNNAAVLRTALDRHVEFVSNRLQRPDGYVLNAVGNPRMRLYNWSMVAVLHLEYARLTNSEEAWQALVRTIRSYYALGGDKYYAIGLPVYEGLKELKQRGRTDDYATLRALFEGHGRRMQEIGTAYPALEVNYEQSIVAPATVFLLELHRATGDAKWLDAARPHLALLELFNGRQPDHHLHEVAIRHWDGYWFGKHQLWGDTFPHYWSTLTAIAFHHYARITGEAGYADRADQIIRNNLSLFTAEGRGAAAFIYPVTVNGRKGHLADPYANDQDWALVHALQLKEV
jgi:hypothetical protein